MKINRLIIPILLLAVFSGCQDVLDKHNLNVVDDQLLWEDPVQATLYINKLYEDNMPGMALGENSGFTDENYSSSETTTNLLYGFVNPVFVDAVKILHKDQYQAIRKINIGIQGLENSPMSEELSAPIKAQAIFLRAYRYWEMVKLYGGIPMILNVQDPYNDDLDVARSKTSESIDIIVADLDECIASLPVEWTESVDQGRITSGAAAAFKARVLLSWASPLFNPENKAERWQRAYDASTQAVDLLSQMSVPRDLHPDYSTIFTSSPLTNVEAVIYKRYDFSAGSDYASGWESSVRPPSGGGNGGYNPTWEFVKAFPMADGKWIDESGSGYDSTYFWQNRDPRFYLTVAHNGSPWTMAGRDFETQWAYDRNKFENSRVPSTGFYCKKATDPTILETNVGQTSTSWHELRYAEVLLTLAECANEVGKKGDALQLIRRIRERAGIESNGGTFGISDAVSKDELLELIMRERQIELSFENKRYWDLRRRLMFRNDLGSHLKKLNGTQRHGLKTVAASQYLRRITDKTSPYFGWNKIDTLALFGHIDINNSENYNSYFTTSLKIMESQVNSQYQFLNYISLYDFFAVTNTFLLHNPAIEQTIGWEQGTFDPLAE